jgi:hypothetical protein
MEQERPKACSSGHAKNHCIPINDRQLFKMYLNKIHVVFYFVIFLIQDDSISCFKIFCCKVKLIFKVVDLSKNLSLNKSRLNSYSTTLRDQVLSLQRSDFYLIFASEVPSSS